MQVRKKEGPLTVKAVAGTYDVLLAFDLEESVHEGCLGFSIERTDLDDQNARRWLPNMVRFPDDQSDGGTNTARAPLQAFRWGDYTVKPGKNYRYRVVPRYGTAAEIIAAAEAGSVDGGVTIDVRTEDTKDAQTAVFFNRGAAASKAYIDKFGDKDPDDAPGAYEWLSRGLEESIVGFIASATGPEYALHACIYEFQKHELLEKLAEAATKRKVDVHVVYHARCKDAAQHDADQAERDAAPAKALFAAAKGGGGDEDGSEKASKDHTRAENEKAIRDTGLDKALGPGKLTPRDANPQGAIMHDKYVVRLKNGVPEAVLTGSTNWTDGGLYGQLNVAHIVTDAKVAATYEQGFQLLSGNPSAEKTKARNAVLTPVPKNVDDIPQGVTPVFSPQSDLAMIELYAAICKRAKLLFISAPFLLHKDIVDVLMSPSNGALRYVMGDKEGSFGKKGAIAVMNGDPGRVGIAATTLKDKLHDFQGKLLEGNESFHHAGVHIHSKIILADPFGDDPILVGGSANFSNGSTRINDSNSLIVRGLPRVTDIYATEFMRMFQQYWFRYRQSQQPDDSPLGLKTTDEWLGRYFAAGTTDSRDRQMFSA
jgi:phosphatidylserine/phosphatidylglycerophosphate/cardiolipin synthase-like enzyme